MSLKCQNLTLKQHYSLSIFINIEVSDQVYYVSWICPYQPALCSYIGGS